MRDIYQSAYWQVLKGRIPANHFPSEVLNHCAKKLSKEDKPWHGITISYTPDGAYLQVGNEDDDNAEDAADSL